MGIVSALEEVRADPAVLLGAVRDALAARGAIKADRGTKFDALCPCHDDSRPSLHVEEGDSGIIMKCRACGAGAQDVLDRLDIPDPYDPGYSLVLPGLFYDRKRHTTGDASQRASVPKRDTTSNVVPIEDAKTKPKPPTKFGSCVSDEDRARLLADETVLDRLDAERCIDADTVKQAGLGLSRDGRIVLPTYDRNGEPSPRLWKPFPEQRSDPNDKMRGPSDASPDIYPRPETPAFADGSDVLLVEGEADALVAMTHGLQAIGCPGVGLWKPDDAQRFVRFGSVTVIADADTQGRKFAAEREHELRSAGVRVVVRDFGDRVAKGYDLTDLAKRCRDEGVALHEAVERLPLIVAGSQVTDLLGEPEPPKLATIGANLFYPDSTHVLFGHGGTGKTYLFLVAAREEIRRGGRVLFLDYETGASTTRRRLDELGFTDEEKARFVHLDVCKGRARPHAGDADYTAALLDAFVPTLIGFDSWSSVHGAGGLGDVKDDEPVEAALAQVFRPMTRDGAAVVILDHAPKGSDAPKGFPFGSQRKHSGTLVVIEATSAGAGRVKLKSWKDNVGDRPTGGAPFAVYTYGDGVASIEPVEPTTESATSGSTFRPTGYMERVSKALEAAGSSGLTATSLQERVGGKQAHVRSARDVLVAEGYVERSAPRSENGAVATVVFVSVKPYREADDVATDDEVF